MGETSQSSLVSGVHANNQRPLEFQSVRAFGTSLAERLVNPITYCDTPQRSEPARTCYSTGPVRGTRPIHVAVFALLGCGLQGGKAWDAQVPAPPPAPVVSLIAIGDAGEPGRHAGSVARRLDEVLKQEHAAGRHPVVLWLGDNVLPRGLSPHGKGPDCTDPKDAWRRRGVAALNKVVRAHIDRGGDSYAVLGGQDWACDNPQLEVQANYADGEHPWLMPDFHYVVRIGRDGATQVVSACQSGGPCTVEPHEGSKPPLVDLVMLDVSPWTDPPAGWTPEHELSRRSLAQLDALFEALNVESELPPPPRILVMHVPVESAGFHGLGGGDPNATFTALPPPVQKGVQAGMFAGVIGGQDRSLQVEPDLTNSVKRSAKVWLAAPTFQVVSGAASRPQRATESSRLFWDGVALEPTLYATHPGFAVVRVGAERVDAVLHRKGAAWKTAGLSFPLRRGPHPVEQPATNTQPCKDCNEVPPGETTQ